MDRDRFEALVEEALVDLPSWVQERLENVAVMIEDEPPEDRNLLGLYEGIPLTNRDASYTWVLPDRIRLFKSTIEAEARYQGPHGSQQGERASVEDVKRVVQETVVHEIAHFFGISEERLRELGWG